MTIPAGCTYYSSCYGCTEELAANYDENATFDDGSCQFPGCTVVGACNYDESANFNDGSCDFFSCLVQGCLNETACNYNPDADLPGECNYPDAGYDVMETASMTLMEMAFATSLKLPDAPILQL